MGTNLFYLTGQYGTALKLTIRHFSPHPLIIAKPDTASSAVLQNFS